jgi:hypothetical protein
MAQSVSTKSSVSHRVSSRWTAEEMVRQPDQPSVDFFVQKLNDFYIELQVNPQMDTKKVRDVRIQFYECIWTDEESAQFRTALKKINDLV